MSEKKPEHVPALSSRGMKSSLSTVLKMLIEKRIDPETANAAAKVAAQMNNIMRTELDAAKLHFEITGQKDNSHALLAIGHEPPDETE